MEQVRLQDQARSKANESTALFKPRIPGDGDGWHRASMEWVAYELNKACTGIIWSVLHYVVV